MIDTDKYEGAKKIVEDAGLIDDNEGHLDVHYRKIAHLLTEVKRLRGILGDIVEIEELGGDGKDICIGIKYGDGYAFSGWLDKVHGGDDE